MVSNILHKSFIAFVAILLITGCQGPRIEKYQTAMDSWIGSDINDYMRQNGYYTGRQSLPSGNTLYLFQKSSTRQLSTYTTPTQTNVSRDYLGNVTGLTTTGGEVYGGGSTTDWCYKYLEVDPNGKIVHWRSEGNNCY